jgi:hypothetical protein
MKAHEPPGDSSFTILEYGRKIWQKNMVFVEELA